MKYQNTLTISFPTKEIGDKILRNIWVKAGCRRDGELLLARQNAIKLYILGYLGVLKPINSYCNTISNLYSLNKNERDEILNDTLYSKFSRMLKDRVMLNYSNAIEINEIADEIGVSSSSYDLSSQVGLIGLNRFKSLIERMYSQWELYVKANMDSIESYFNNIYATHLDFMLLSNGFGPKGSEFVDFDFFCPIPLNCWINSNSDLEPKYKQTNYYLNVFESPSMMFEISSFKVNEDGLSVKIVFDTDNTFNFLPTLEYIISCRVDRRYLDVSYLRVELDDDNNEISSLIETFSDGIQINRMFS